MSNPENKDQGKGFEGLQSLGAKSPEVPAPVERKPERPVLPPAWQDNSSQQTAQPAPIHSQTAASPWRYWVIGLGILGAIVVLSVWVGNQSSSNAPYSPSSATGYSSAASESTQADPAPEPAMRMPPVGNGLVLTSEQIRYCVYEDRRIKGAEKVVNSYNQWSVDTFNAMVEDYNSRCGHYQYRQGALTPIEREADQIRTQLEQEGRERLIDGDAAAADAAQAAADTAVTAADATAAAANAAAANATSSTDSRADADVWFENIELGSRIGSDLSVLTPTTSFRSMDTIYAVVTTATSGGEVAGVLRVRWSYGEDDQTVHEEMKPLQFSGNGVTAFQISKPDGWPQGDYRVQVTLDGRETKARTFSVL